MSGTRGGRPLKSRAKPRRSYSSRYLPSADSPATSPRVACNTGRPRFSNSLATSLAVCAEESADDDDASGTTEADPAAEAAEAGEDDLEEARDLRYEMTKLDRDFLRTVRIQPESG